jgi:hypothetical protein
MRLIILALGFAVLASIPAQACRDPNAQLTIFTKAGVVVEPMFDILVKVRIDRIDSFRPDGLEDSAGDTGVILVVTSVIKGKGNVRVLVKLGLWL